MLKLASIYTFVSFWRETYKKAKANTMPDL